MSHKTTQVLLFLCMLVLGIALGYILMRRRDDDDDGGLDREVPEDIVPPTNEKEISLVRQSSLDTYNRISDLNTGELIETGRELVITNN